MLGDLSSTTRTSGRRTFSQDRTSITRSRLTINRLPQFVRQVVNQARQSKPAIQVNPVDNGADPDTAEVLQGIMRHIERHSKAHIAYATASASTKPSWAAAGGASSRSTPRDDSMEQEIRIKRIIDAFTVYPDPSCSSPITATNFCFIIERSARPSTTPSTRGRQDAGQRRGVQSVGDDARLGLTDGISGRRVLLHRAQSARDRRVLSSRWRHRRARSAITMPTRKAIKDDAAEAAGLTAPPRPR
jgi:hypothetical protein